jgi:hypothetical protein
MCRLGKHFNGPMCVDRESQDYPRHHTPFLNSTESSV